MTESIIYILAFIAGYFVGRAIAKSKYHKPCNHLYVDSKIGAGLQICIKCDERLLINYRDIYLGNPEYDFHPQAPKQD